MKFDELNKNFSLPRAEEAILEFWEANQVFEKTNQMVQDRPHFVFYEGPPTANGRPGIHHVLSRTIKDLVCRYKTMRGFRVDRKGGWDTHGLPVEIEVEKQLNLNNKKEVIEYGIGPFNKKCRESVFKYLEEWNRLTRRIGYWLDLEDAYVTLKNEYIETVWYLLKQLYDKDLIYKGHRTTAYCTRCGTGLSSHEVAQGYAEITDPSVFVKMKDAQEDFYYLVWTTTPWTLPSNVALCVSPQADYVLVEHEGEKLLLAEALVEEVLGESKQPIKKFKGSDLLKRKYTPLFDFFADQADKAFYVIGADFVTLEDGTGIVHVAPGYGADDYVVGQKYSLPVVQAVGVNGLFKDFAGKYAGTYIKDADKEIIRDLKIGGKLFKREQYKHNYPFCWRCDTPLIYIAVDSWYIKTTAFKQQLIDNNNAIYWHPDEVRTGRMADWLENNVDWCLSRERFWGTPLPIWLCDKPNCDEVRAVGSIKQLRDEGIDIPDEIDLHKPMMDDLKLRCECGGTMTRTPEVIDCWFDSGAMPYAQWHWPFDNKDILDIKHPADFISEGVDQTRGWFYSLLAISTMLFGKSAFKHVLVHDLILDKEGKKMSKSRGNAVDPMATADKFGADPIRWYLMSVSNPWLPTKFDQNALAEVGRKFFDTLRNTYSFFALYANIDSVVEQANEADLSIEAYLESKAGESERFDEWIWSKYNTLTKEAISSFDQYDITRPTRAIQYFVIEELSNWYVRNNRRRFWAKGDDPSKMRAYLTLYRVLEGVCRLIAPLAPFTSELLWKELMGDKRADHGLPLSIHMTDYPKPDESAIKAELEKNMGLVEKIVQLGRAARSRKNLKVRQPLAKLMVGLSDNGNFDSLKEYLPIIERELNVKTTVSAEDLNQYVTLTAKLNFKVAGSKLGKNAKAAAAWLGGLDSDRILAFESNKKITVDLAGDAVTLELDDLIVNREEVDGYVVESDSSVTIAIVTDLTEELINEGFARELVNKIQNMRKSSGLKVTDHICVRIGTNKRLRNAAGSFEEFIKKETLSQKLDLVEQNQISDGTDWNINGEPAIITVDKV